MDRAGVRRGRVVRIKKERRITTRVVVVDGANVETEITEGFLPSAVEIHFDVAADITGALAYVGVPVAQIKAARMAVIEAALDRGLAERLVDAAEPVFRSEGDVSGHRRRGRCGLLRLCAERRGGCRCKRDWNDELTH